MHIIVYWDSQRVGPLWFLAWHRSKIIYLVQRRYMTRDAKWLELRMDVIVVGGYGCLKAIRKRLCKSSYWRIFQIMDITNSVFGSLLFRYTCVCSAPHSAVLICWKLLIGFPRPTVNGYGCAVECGGGWTQRPISKYE